MRALVFDLDGTLVDTVYPHILAWQRAFAANGVAVEASRLHPLIGLSGDLFISAVGRQLRRRFSPAAVHRLDRTHSRMFKRLAAPRLPLPGALALLRHLQRRGIRHGIATSGKREEIAPSLKALQLGPTTLVVGAEEAANPKPAPDPLLECVERLSVPKEECYLVGDSIWDLLAARRAGLHSLAVATGGRPPEELAHAGASRVFHTLEDLLGAFEELGLS